MMNPPGSPKSARRGLRLSVRGLIFIVLAIGVGLGWFELRARSQAEAVAAVEKSGGGVSHNLAADDDGVPTNAWARWLVGAFGIDRVATVVGDTGRERFDDDALVAVSRLASLEKLELFDCPVTDAGVIAGLGNLTRLKALSLRGYPAAFPKYGKGLRRI